MSRQYELWEFYFIGSIALIAVALIAVALVPVALIAVESRLLHESPL